MYYCAQDFWVPSIKEKTSFHFCFFLNKLQHIKSTLNSFHSGRYKIEKDVKGSTDTKSNNMCLLCFGNAVAVVGCKDAYTI